MKNLLIIQSCILILCLFSSCEKEEVEKLEVRYLEGYVYERSTKEPIANANITLKEDYFGSVFLPNPSPQIAVHTTKTDENGFYRLEFEDTGDFSKIRVDKDGYGYYDDDVSIYEGIKNDEKIISNNTYLVRKAWLKIHFKNINPIDSNDGLNYHTNARYHSSSSDFELPTDFRVRRYYGADVDFEKVETVQADTALTRKWKSIKGGVTVLVDGKTLICGKNDTCFLTIHY